MVRVNGRAGWKVNGGDGGTPLPYKCAALLTIARIKLYLPIPANQETRSSLLQFAAGEVHHKCFKWAAPIPPLNEYACKPCFWEARERTSSLQHWRCLDKRHGNLYLLPSKKRSTPFTGPPRLMHLPATSLPPQLSYLLGCPLQHFTVSSKLCGFYLHCDWLSNIPDENVIGSIEMWYCYQTHLRGALTEGACGSGYETMRAPVRFSCGSNNSVQYRVCQTEIDISFMLTTNQKCVHKQ